MTAQGVVGTNAPGLLTKTTVDFGFALLLAAARRITEGERYLRAGLWIVGSTTCLLTLTFMGQPWAFLAWAASARRWHAVVTLVFG